MLIVAGTLYVGGASVVVGYSYTQVEALPAPAVPVVLMTAPPPPPPPPPPPAAHHQVSTTQQPRRVIPNVLLQPSPIPVVPQPKTAASDVANGVPGGEQGGVNNGILGGQINGVIGSIIDGPLDFHPGVALDTTDETEHPAQQSPQVKQVTPDAALEHRLCCDPQMISRPTQAVTAHVFGTTSVTVCVDPYGNVTSVSPVASLQFITDKVTQTIQATWKFKPFEVNGVPSPACFLETFQYQEAH
jgi:protein TonB